MTVPIETKQHENLLTTLLEEYRPYVQADGTSERSIGSYLSDVARFLAYQCDQQNRPLDGTVRGYVVDFLDNVRPLGLKPATFNKLVNSLSCFFAYLAEQGRIPTDRRLLIPKSDGVKLALGSEQEVSVLTDRQLDQLTRLLERGGEVSQRDRLIVLFLLYTGCRVSELVDTKLSGLDLMAGLVTVKGKGNKLREIPLWPDLAREIQPYLSGERRQGKFATSEYLFVSQRAAKLNRDTVNTILERLQSLGKLSFHLHPHLFRHTFCSRLVARNVPLTTVQRLAGHASVHTTATTNVNTSCEFG